MTGLLTRFRTPPEAERLGTPWLLALSVLFGLAAVAGGVLGLVGVLRIDAQQGYDLNAFDVLQGVVALYSGGSPAWLAPSTPLPPSYDVARVVAPLSTGYVLAATVSVLLAERWRLVRARLARGHSVVCGAGRPGVLLARALAREGTTVLVAVDASSRPVLTSLVRRVVPVSGDPRDVVVLRRAGVARARRLFALDAAGDTNAAVAVAAKRLVRNDRRPLDCYALIEDPELQITLQALLLSTVTAPSFRLHLVDPHRVFASRVVSAETPRPGWQVLVAGSGSLAVALASEVLRSAPLVGRVVLAGPTAPSVRDAVLARLPAPTDETLLEVATDGLPDVDLVYVCESSDQQTVKTGLSWWARRASAATPVVLCVEADTGLSGAVAAGEAGLVVDSRGLLRVHSRSAALSDPAAIASQTVTERLARAMHGEYLREYAASAHRPVRSDWADLPEQFKESNRDQARQIAVKLTALGCALVPSMASLPRFALEEAEIEELARMEHVRWVEERARSGLRYGPDRTPTTHPDMVTWRELTEEGREKDRVFIRALPRLLAQEGFVVVRVA